MEETNKCPECGANLIYNPQIQEYAGAAVWNAYYSCSECDYSKNLPINDSSVRENFRGW